MTKLNKYKFSILINVLLAAILLYQVIPLIFNGIIVKSQRTTGPELIVLNGQEILKRKLNRDDVIYNEVFLVDDLDTENGPYRIDRGILLCDVVGVKNLSKDEKFPLIKVKTISLIEFFYFELAILGILFMTFTYFVYKLKNLQSTLNK